MPPRSLPKPLRASLQWLKRLASVKLPEPTSTIGLDIGSSAVKVVALGARTGAAGTRSVVGAQTVALKASSEAPAEAEVVSAIQQAIQALGISLKAVNASVSGQAVIMRVIEMPRLAPQELGQALPFEAQRHLPFNLQDVFLDGAILGEAGDNKQQVLLVACKRDVVEARIAWIRQAGLEPALLDVDALALANAWLQHAAGGASPQTCAVLNVGAQWSNLAILKDATPFLVRDIPWGAQKCLSHLAQQLGRQEAELRAQLSQEADLPAELVDPAREACESLAADLQLSFDFFENRFGNAPEQLMMTGGFSRCSGFVKAVKSHLAQPLSVWTPCEGLTEPFAVAYGLALR